MKIISLALLCICLASCTPEVREEDRQLIEQGEQIAALQDQEYARIIQAISDGDLPKAKGLAVAVRSVNADAGLNASILKANLGAPKQTVAYSAASAEALRAASKKAHTDVGFFAWLIGALGTGGAVALGIARSPLAKMIPGFGPVFAALDSTITGVEKWMAAQKEAGNHDVVADLASTLFSEHDGKGVAGFVQQRIEKAKENI